MLALELFHGRTHHDENLEGWGSAGPVFLIESVHVTYGGDLRLALPDRESEGELHYVEDLVFYDGVYYGDWSVFPAAIAEADSAFAVRITPFDPSKAIRPRPRQSKEHVS